MRSLRKIKLILSIVFMAFCLFSMLKSCSYAYTKDEWANLAKADLQVLKDKGVLGTDYNLSDLRGPDFPSYTLSYYILIGSGFGGNYNGTTVWIIWSRSTATFNHANNGNDLYFKSGGNTYTESDGNLYRADTGASIARGTFSIRGSNLIYVYAPMGTFDYDEENIHLLAGEEWGGSYLTASFDFVPNYDYIVNQDGFFGVQTKKYSYSQRSWLLGQITSYLEDYPIIHMKLYDQNYSGDYIAESYYNTGTQVNSSTDLYVNSIDNKLYVKSRLLYYNNIYTLVLYPETASGTISSDNYVGTFLYLPVNANVSGDVVVSVGDGDFTNQNQINDLLYIPTESGDLGLINMPSINIEDPSNDFFVWLLAELQDFFTNFNNTTLTIPILTEDFIIPSNYFVMDDGPLKTFLSIGWWFACGVPILKWMRYMIETIRSGNIPQVDDKSDLLNNVL